MAERHGSTPKSIGRLQAAARCLSSALCRAFLSAGKTQAAV